jgi:hypothetical protein
MLALLLALAWAPLTTHCELESASGLEFLRCASVGQPPEGVPGHCDDASCCGVESAKYPVPSQRPIVPVFTLVPAPFGVVAHCELPQPLKVTPDLPATAPPELSTAWQFISRTASLCRAPSLVA